VQPALCESCCKKNSIFLAPAAHCNDDAEDSSSGYLSSDDGGVRSDSSNEEDEGETEDEIEDNVSQGTVETFDSIDFLTPGGLSSFTVAFPSKSD
jgi:hypothetical protein